MREYSLVQTARLLENRLPKDAVVLVDDDDDAQELAFLTRMTCYNTNWLSRHFNAVNPRQMADLIRSHGRQPFLVSSHALPLKEIAMNAVENRHIYQLEP